jgi:hypothetical protein
VVTRLIDDHVGRREDRSRQLWGLLAFTLWHEHHVERVPGRPKVAEIARREGLGRHDGERTRARLPSADPESCRGRGDEVEITAREYAQTLQLLELHGLEAEVIGKHGGRSRTGKARAMWSRIRRAATLGEGARVRRRARARLARADHDGEAARHPELDDVRLRVRVAPAPARLPSRDEGRRPRRDPAQSASGPTASTSESSCNTRG